MGDNLVHAQGPEKTRKNQTSYAHAKSAGIRNLFELMQLFEISQVSETLPNK